MPRLRLDGFARTLLFGGLVALALPAVWLLLAPALGPRLGLGLALTAATAAYLVGIAPSRRAAATAGAAAAILGAGVLALATTRAELALGCAGVLAVCRSGLLYRSRPLRALALETALAAAGLALAGLVAGPGPLGTALGVWGFFLVQSIFFLAGGVSPARAAAERDPFDEVRARLQALLDEDPV